MLLDGLVGAKPRLIEIHLYIVDPRHGTDAILNYFILKNSRNRLYTVYNNKNNELLAESLCTATKLSSYECRDL